MCACVRGRARDGDEHGRCPVGATRTPGLVCRRVEGKLERCTHVLLAFGAQRVAPGELKAAARDSDDVGHNVGSGDGAMDGLCVAGPPVGAYDDGRGVGKTGLALGRKL